MKLLSLIIFVAAALAITAMTGCDYTSPEEQQKISVQSNPPPTCPPMCREM
jgi:hypothetical protein